MADKRDKDGFVYYGDRKVHACGKIKVDNEWYQHDNLINFVGETIFIFNTGSYWKTEYSCYPYWAPFKEEYKICVIK